MRCIFVLDIFNSAVVHAVKGMRSTYEAVNLVSKIVSTSDPFGVIQEIKPREVYVADLNMITGDGDNLAAINTISQMSRTMADIGLSRAEDLDLLPKRVTPVLGSETASLELMEEMAIHREIVVSIDMKCRKVLTRDPKLEQAPLDVLKKLNGFSLAGVILLELDRVGTSMGLDKKFLEKAVCVSDHALILGGGVKGVEDLNDLENMGFRGALVATAVHIGSIPLEMVR